MSKTELLNSEVEGCFLQLVWAGC